MRSALLPALLVAFVLGQVPHEIRHSSALWDPPRIIWPDSKKAGSVLHQISVGGLPVVLDSTPLEDVRQRLGGTIGFRGDASNAEAWLCYAGLDANGQWILWLTSDEINGGAVGGFIWMRVQRGQSPDRRCRSLHGQSPIELQVPIRLGLTRAQTMKILGPPTSAHGEIVSYVYEQRREIDGTAYMISNGLELLFRNGIVTQIAAFEISSN